MDNFLQKAENYFILALIAEKIGMRAESATNYFKALSALDDSVLSQKNLKAKDHSERFLLLKQHFPELYRITDKLFLVYRRTYTSEITKEEVKLLKENIENVFRLYQCKIPTYQEVEKRIRKIS